MRKDLNQISSQGRIVFRGVAAVSLTLALALLSCTTNKTPGDGQPISSPSVGPTNVSATPGSSSGTTYVPPQAMYSSSTDAIADLAADHAYRGHALGAASPVSLPTTNSTVLAGARRASTTLMVDPGLLIESGDVPPLIGLAGDAGGSPASVAVASNAMASPAASGMAASRMAAVSVAPRASTAATVNGANLMAGATVAAGAGATSITPVAPTTAPSGGATNNANAGGTVASTPVALGIAGGTLPANVAAQASSAGTIGGVTPPRPTAAKIAGPGTAPAASTNVTSVPTVVPGSSTSPATVPAVTSTTVTAGMTIGSPIPASAGTMTPTASATITPATGGRVRAVRPTGAVTAPVTVVATRTVHPGGTTPSPVKSAQTGRTRVVMPPTASTRTRPVRVTSAPDGTAVVTNAPSPQ
jgi:hypothetical protein